MKGLVVKKLYPVLMNLVCVYVNTAYFGPSSKLKNRKDLLIVQLTRLLSNSLTRKVGNDEELVKLATRSFLSLVTTSVDHILTRLPALRSEVLGNHFKSLFKTNLFRDSTGLHRHNLEALLHKPRSIRQKVRRARLKRGRFNKT